jgi:hypothetical protein
LTNGDCLHHVQDVHSEQERGGPSDLDALRAGSKVPRSCLLTRGAIVNPLGSECASWLVLFSSLSPSFFVPRSLASGAHCAWRLVGRCALCVVTESQGAKLFFPLTNSLASWSLFENFEWWLEISEWSIESCYLVSKAAKCEIWKWKRFGVEDEVRC